MNFIQDTHFISFSKQMLFVYEFQKNIYFHFIDYAKAIDCVDNNKLENS